MYQIMDMCSREIERDDPSVAACEADPLRAGWNPVLAAMGHQDSARPPPAPPRDVRGALPPELATCDIGLFLQRMYASQD